MSKEVGFQLYPGATGSTKASLGGVDWSKYKNLRIQFNAYLDYENIIYFRTVRIKDGVIEQEGNNHVIGVGTPAKPEEETGNKDTANTGTADHIYKYRRMTPNMWHNVVMEL